ncbi:MAG: hypothetical protein RLZZ187_3763 [Pseudomonadota bacterium]|jgi:hypothetical protein
MSAGGSGGAQARPGSTTDRSRTATWQGAPLVRRWQLSSARRSVSSNVPARDCQPNAPFGPSARTRGTG